MWIWLVMFGLHATRRFWSPSSFEEILSGRLRLRPSRSRWPSDCGMMTGVSGIYDEPELYQLACAYRDVPAESGALLSWLDKHAKIADGVRSVIELAAGPAEHARELAHRGLRGQIERRRADCVF